MAILKLKDKNGNIYSVPAFQGDAGNLVFTKIEQEEVKDMTLDAMPQAEEMLL